MMAHLKALQKETGLLIIALVISVLIVGISSYYRDAVAQQKEIANGALSAAREKYNDARNRKKLLEDFEKKYKQLEQSGVVGEEQRLNWVDLIESLSNQYGIAYVKYRIEKQQRVNDPGLIDNYPEIDVFKSKMKLDMQLLHEGDLYRLLNTLEQKAQGLFDVNSCTLIRNNINAKSIVEEASNRNFHAECTLNWYTITRAGTVSYQGEQDENAQME